MFEISTSPQPIFGVLRNGIKLFKKTWLKLLPIAVLLIGIEVFLIKFLPMQQMSALMMHNPAGFSAFSQQISPKYLLLMVLAAIVMPWLSLVMLYRCYQIMIVADSGYLGAVIRALFKFFPYFVASFLYMIVVVLGSVVFVIPGVFLLILFMFNGLGILIDGKAIFSSFVYSAKLVWGNWWRTFMVFLLTFVLSIIAILFITIIANIILVSLFHVNMFGGSAVMAMNIIVILLVLFMFILFVNIFVCQYYDLKLRLQLKR